MEFYESTYFIILIPSVVIAMIFLFFWLFMKETSYDEVLAKQKKDLKLPPLKVDKKKVEKKKNKKKESQNGHLHESDSETANREFDLMDALSSEEEHVVPAPVIEAEPAVNVRERKKKDKKPPKLVTEEPAGKEINGTKPPGKKAELVPVTKQPTPPIDASGSKKKQGAKKLKNGTDQSPVSQEIKNEQVVPSTKKQEPPSPPADVKPQESGSGKKRITVKKQKIDTLSALVNEPLIQAAVYVPLMDNTAEQVVEKKVEKEAAVRADPAEGPPRGGGKKAKAVTDKENAEVKFKDVVSAMRSLTLSEEEAMAVMETLKEKSRAVQEIVRKANKGDAAALQQLQEKERLLVAAREEAAGVKEQYKHLSQELLGEKQKSNLMEAKARERIAAMEKEHGVFQSKMHSSYQDAQQMQLKFQQVREQLETQLGHLKQENSILRDAVSSATNQMESKQSGELNKLRQDCTRLVNELAEKNNKMVQEEMQKKSSEQVASQLKAQIQEAERRVEEAETYLRSRLAECDVIQQDMQGKLLTKESEIQTLHSKFTDTMVSNQQLEQRILQLMEASQSEGLQMHIQDLLKQNEALNLQIQKYHSQMHAQSSASVLVEELQKTISEKDKEMKQLENTLSIEHSNFINSGEEFKVIQRENLSLKSDLLKLQAAVNEQAVAAQALDLMQKSVRERDQKIRTLEEQLQREVAKVSSNLEDYTANREVLGKMEMSMQEKEDKIKTVEELLEAGLIEMANKEEELRVLRSENASLRTGVENLRTQQANQVSLDSVVEDLKQVILEKEGKMKSVEDLLQAEHQRANKHEKTEQTLREEVESLKEALKISQQEKAQQVSNQTQIQELQKRLKQKEEALQLLEVRSTEREGEVTIKERRLKDLEKDCDALKVHIEEVEKKLQQKDSAPVQNLQKIIIEQEEKVKALAASLAEREAHLADTCQELQVLGAEHEALKARSRQHQQQTQQVQFATAGPELLRALSDKDAQIEALREEAESLKSALEQQRKKNNDLREKNWKAMDALASTEKMLQNKVNKTAKGERLQEFGKTVKGLNESDAERVKVLEQKLKEGEEIHSLLQLECEKYKSVLAETEGILQRLQRSVEEEEGRWKVKVEESQKELKEVLCTVRSLEEEMERLKNQDKESQNLRKEREHLETELEKAEHDRASYVSEVRELKDLLTELQLKLDGSYSEASRQNEELALLKTRLRETLQKLEFEQSERQKVAKDVHEAQKSLDLIELEILKAAGDVTDSDPTCDAEPQEPREKTLQSLSQSVTRLQQCLQALNQQLTKGREHYQVIG